MILLRQIQETINIFDDHHEQLPTGSHKLMNPMKITK